MSANQQNVTIRSRLVGHLQTIQGLNAVAAASARVSAATAAQGAAADSARRKTFLWNQAMFTLRRGLYSATLITTGLTLGAAAMGFQFNLAMERSETSMKFFLGSAQAAQKELDFLFELAKRTPFEFQPLVQASTGLLAVGFNAKQVNATMEILGDTIAGLGLSSEGIQRAVIAISQMAAKGRIMGDELLQLQELGIPAMTILQEQFNLTADQMKNIGELGIKSSQGIPALLIGLQKQFKGAAEAQAGTASGMITTLTDSVRQLMGKLTESMFNMLKRTVLPQAIALVDTLNEAFKAGGFTGFINQLDKSAGAMGFLSRTIFALRDIFYGLWLILSKAIFPAFKDLLIIVGPPLVLLLMGLGEVLKFVGEQGDIVHWILVAMITLPIINAVLTLSRAILFGLVGALRKAVLWLTIDNAVMFIARIRSIALTVAIIALYVWEWLLAVLLRGKVIGAIILTIVQLKLFTIWNSRAAMAVRFLALWIVRSLIPAIVGFIIAFAPIILTILVVIAVIALLVIAGYLLYKNWDKVTKAIGQAWDWLKGKANDIFEWIKDNWVKLLIYIFFPPAIAFELAKRVWAPLKRGFLWVLQEIEDAWKWFKKHVSQDWKLPIPGFGSSGGGFRIRPIPYLPFEVTVPYPHMQEGGITNRPGPVVVGERGPEILNLPAFSQITPLDHPLIQGGDKQVIELTSKIYLDKRKIGEAIQTYRLDRQARF